MTRPFWHVQVHGPHGQPSSRWWHPSARHWRAADHQAGQRGKEEANAGWTRRVSSLFNAVFSIHLQPVLNHTFQCVLRVGNAIVCLFPAGSWRCWCRRPVCKQSMCVSRVLACAGMPLDTILSNTVPLVCGLNPRGSLENTAQTHGACGAGSLWQLRTHRRRLQVDAEEGVEKR